MKLTQQFLLENNPVPFKHPQMEEITKVQFQNLRRENAVLLIPINFQETTEELFEILQNATGDAKSMGKPITRLDLSKEDKVYKFKNKYNTFYLVRTVIDFSKDNQSSRTDTVVDHILYVEK